MIILHNNHYFKSIILTNIHSYCSCTVPTNQIFLSWKHQSSRYIWYFLRIRRPKSFLNNGTNLGHVLGCWQPLHFLFLHSKIIFPPNCFNKQYSFLLFIRMCSYPWQWKKEHFFTMQVFAVKITLTHNYFTPDHKNTNVKNNDTALLYIMSTWNDTQKSLERTWHKLEYQT